MRLDAKLLADFLGQRESLLVVESAGMSAGEQHVVVAHSNRQNPISTHFHPSPTTTIPIAPRESRGRADFCKKSRACHPPSAPLYFSLWDCAN